MRVALLGTLVMGIVVVSIVSIYTAQKFIPASYLTVHFLDVGQGDAIFIETPDKIQVLIDGGPDGSVLRELGAVMSPFDKIIDLVIATHNDKDHIGGLIDVLARYQVSAIMQTNNEQDTTAAEQFAQGVIDENAVQIKPTVGQRYILGASTTVTIFSPVGDVANHESNTSSLVVKLEYGDTSFLLTGDAPKGIEDYLAAAYGEELQSDVLKLGHHGSRTSTSVTFLASVLPSYAVVSAGKGNSYGHPHAEVVENVEAIKSRLLSTAELGIVTFYSDGTSVWLEE